MIRFTLKCPQKHIFEAWFASNEDYETQQRKHMILCPMCNSSDIEKDIMAPALAKNNLSKKQENEQKKQHQQIYEKIREFKRKAENVGEKFPQEARKIYFKEAKQRPIIGKTSIYEATKLIEEGIPVLPLPTLPEEKN